jgi:hypothetical protein
MNGHRRTLTADYADYADLLSVIREIRVIRGKEQNLAEARCAPRTRMRFGVRLSSAAFALPLHTTHFLVVCAHAGPLDHGAAA